MFKKGHKPVAKKGAKKTAPRKKAKKFLFPAPKDMKPFFLHILCQTGKDGLLTGVDAIRFKGRPDNAKAKRVTLSETDPVTLAAIAARLGGTSFVTNVTKRLPAKAAFLMECRVRVDKEDNIGFGVRYIKMKLNGSKKTLSKKNPIYRKLRKCTRFMPAAFMKVGEFPVVKKEKATKEADE